MTTTTTTTTSSPVDEALNQTELGGWIAKNKALVISVIVLILVGIISYGVTTNLTMKKHNQYANTLFQFEKTKYSALINGKITAADFVADWKEVSKDMDSFGSKAALEIKIVEQLINKNEKQLALSLLEERVGEVKNPYFSYFYRTYLASLYEDLGQHQKAIDQLKPLVSSSTKYLEGKLYVDLGRLHLAIGEKEAAKTNFQYIVDNIKDAEFVRIANLYLADLK